MSGELTPRPDLPASWVRPPRPPARAEGEIHVWAADVAAWAAFPEHVRALLSEEEIARSERGLSDAERLRGLVGRALRRQVLAGYLGVPPAELSFGLGHAGKPFLAGRHGGLRFNLSHSGGLALLAVTAGSGEVGVDVERFRDQTDTLASVARRFFTPLEAAVIQERGPEAFFACWTRKEALLKALGDGLRVPLGAYEVGADPAGPAAMGVGPETSWSLRDLPVGPGYRAAVCVQAGDAGLLDRMRTLVATPPGAADRP